MRRATERANKAKPLDTPSWFSLEKYECFNYVENPPPEWYQLWANALYGRFYIDQCLNKCQKLSDGTSTLDLAKNEFELIKRNPCCENSEPHSNLRISTPIKPVKPTTFNELYFLDDTLSENTDINSIYREEQKIYKGRITYNSLFLTVDLNSSDNEIKNSLLIELEEYRAKYKIPDPIKITPGTIKSWARNKLLPILDLHHFWPRVDEIPIDSSHLRKVIRLVHKDWSEEQVGDYTKKERFGNQKESALTLQNIHKLATLASK